MSPGRSPAVIVRFPATATAAGRDRLVSLLAEHGLVAIQEDDLQAPRAWTAHFESAPARDAAADALRALDPSLTIEPADVEDEDWAARTQQDLPAVRVGRLVIAPPWDIPPGGHGDPMTVVIEPSRGFGTGHHQSTRLCLVLLQDRPLADVSVLDIGTGSGVLSIVAARLGAEFVTAIDVDPDAIDNARENITANGVSAVVEAHVRDLADPSLPPADLVLANLTGTLLVRHAARLTALVRPRGELIVSGFTVDEKDAVHAAFDGAFQLRAAAEEDGWWACVLTATA